MNNKTQKLIIQNIWMTLLVISYGLFSYYYFKGWWYSSVGTLLILFFSYLTWKKEFLKITGLKINLKTLLKAVLITVIVFLGSLAIMSYIASKCQIIIIYTSWKNYFHDIFYILNEEIVIGAILLFSLVKIYKVSPVISSISLAFIFSIIHFVFYKWIFDDRGIIETSALISLFLIGFVRNNLILQTGHIAYSWALHFGWMVVMFGSQHIYAGTKNTLSEPIRFNTYLGSTEMVIISSVLAFISIIYWIKQKPKHTLNTNHKKA